MPLANNSTGALASRRRPYRLGKRATSVDVTRQRILEAALAEFTDAGIDATSMLSVSRRADLAPGTVLYHFASIDDLVGTVVGLLAKRATLPSPTELQAGDVRALIRAVYDLFEQTQDIYAFYARNHDNPLLVARLNEYQRAFDDLVTAVLAPHVGSPRAVPVVSALLEPPFYFSLQRRGLDLEAAVETATTMANAAIAAARKPGRRGHR